MGEWLEQPFKESDGDDEFQQTKMMLKDLKVITDPAELCIIHIQEYCSIAMHIG